MRAVCLKTASLTDPLGIDLQHPLLSWNDEGGIRQTAFQIVTEKWDSGKVKSSSMHAEYPLPLRSREQVEWKVRVWDENDTPGSWSTACFETGFLEPEDWQASWISGDYKARKKRRYPADCFRKRFFLEKPVCTARLYITACGLYEARLAGKKIGEFCLAPGYTDYRKRVQYQTYDVTALLQAGENELTVQLADGWYRGSCGAWGLLNQYGTETKLRAQLEICFEDGSREVILSDESFAWSNDGPVRFADNQDGEIVEAFRTPTYSGHARRVKHPVVPTASNNVPVTEHEHFRPVITKAPNGRWLLDFGQNIAGYICFRLNARRGQRIFFRFGEMLDAEGNLTQKNFQMSSKKRTTSLQQIDYTCAEGPNEYKTAFAVFGFRYAEVETDVTLDPDVIEAIAVYSDLKQTGFFRSSNELLDRFVDATLWSAKGNHLDIPTDCPTRERHGWTGDAQIFARTAVYLFDFAPFARKYLRDLVDVQHKNGNFVQIAPVGGVDFYMKVMDGSAGWSDAGVLIPSVLYEQYRDPGILKEFYPAMRRYAMYKIGTLGKWYPTAVPTGVGLKAAGTISNYGQSYGEWAEPSDVKAFSVSEFTSPHPEETTAYIVYLLQHMEKIARVLNEAADEQYFRETAEKVKSGYQKLVSKEKFSLDTDRQAKLVRPLYMGLLDKTQEVYAKERLLKALDHYGWRLGTGFLSTPLILYVLADMDVEYAYRLLENEEIPGWLSMPKHGANTVWESWEGPYRESGGTDSLNHYSKGAVTEWLFAVMCGIRVDGENHFSVSPQPGGHFRFAEASYESVFGRIESGWTRNEKETVFTVTVPANCTAQVTLPDGSSREQQPGTAAYTVPAAERPAEEGRK